MATNYSIASVFQPELFLVAVAHGLGLSAPDETTARERLAAYFQNKRLLLILDNFEQILEFATEAAHWLEKAPGLKVLVTSRARLRLVAENEYPVPPMGTARFAKSASPDRIDCVVSHSGTFCSPGPGDPAVFPVDL